MSDRKWDVELVDDLIQLAKPESPDRAALAHLRQGLNYSLDYTLSRVGWLFRRVPEFALDEAVLAAGLFAWVKGECPHERPQPDSKGKQTNGPNFGATFGAGLTLDEKQQREKRFVDLLDTDREELPYKLRQAITLIAGTPLDWVLLIRHLGHWNHPDRWVQKEWARGFWSAATEDETIIATTDQPVSD